MLNQENENENVFSEPLIGFFCDSTNSTRVFNSTDVELSREEIYHRIIFSANYLMVLRAQGRISSDYDELLQYNEMIDSYIRFLV